MRPHLANEAPLFNAGAFFFPTQQLPPWFPHARS
jgi:hypothetical protein